MPEEDWTDIDEGGAWCLSCWSYDCTDYDTCARNRRKNRTIDRNCFRGNPHPDHPWTDSETDFICPGIPAVALQQAIPGMGL